MKLAAEVTVKKTMFGKIRHYTAKLGNWEADGANKKEAEANLAATIARLAEENADPVVRLDPDGHAWIAFRSSFGAWVYGHARLFDGGKVGQTRIGGWTMLGSDATRSRTVEAMDRYFDDLHFTAKEGA
jgi:hypothetical protein